VAKQTWSHPKKNGAILRGWWLPELAVAMLGLLVWAQAAVKPSPPETKRADVVDNYSGAKVPDPYSWLENQSSPETRAWIERENAYSRSLLSPLPGRQDIERELAQLMKVDETNLPLERNGRYFFSRRLANQDLFVIYMRPGLHSQDEVLIDPHPLSADHTVSVGIQDVAQDGALMVYGIRQGGQDETSLRFFDVGARKDLPDQLPRALYESASLERDKSGLFYARDTPDGPRVFHHNIGTDPARDEEVFGKGYGKDKIILCSVSEGGHFLIIHVYHGSSGDQTEIYFQDLLKRGPIRPVVTDIAARFEAHAAGDKLFVHTNW
jgi:prolyl oligopeptidase